MIALLSYNAIGSYDPGIHNLQKYQLLMLPNSFNPKCQKNVNQTDLNWQLLLKYKESISKFIVFAGKKESGSLEIIDLVCKEFKTTEKKVFFVLCDHDLDEKIQRIQSHGYQKDNYMHFTDNVLPCQEAPLLLGYALGYICRM